MEEQRIAALYRLELLDTLEEEEFTELTRLAAEICTAPMARINFIDRDRQWPKAAVGVDLEECSRETSFCTHAIESSGLFIVPDATKDPMFRENPHVTGSPGIVFYAATVLRAPGGFAVGTLCVFDTVPRKLSQSQKRALALLGRQVQVQMQLRVRQRKLEGEMAAKQQMLAKLESTQDLFRAFVNHGPSANYIKDAEGRMLFYNRCMANTFGVSDEEWLNKTDAELWPPEVAAKFRENDLRVLETGENIEVNESSPGMDGRARHWKSWKFPFHRNTGEVVLAGMSIDVTDEVDRQEELNRALAEKSEMATQLSANEALFHSFMDNTPNLSFLKDDEGRYLFYNRAFAVQYGIDQKEWLGKTVHDVLPPRIAEQFTDNDQRLLKTGITQEDVSEIANSAGEPVVFRWLKFIIKDGQGRNTIAGVAVDLTAETHRQLALTEANTRLERLATTDALTGLSNRGVFETRIAIEFGVSTRKRRPLAVVMMDIDNFKKRNDQFGHAAGDEAIRLLGKILLANVRLGDLAARIGGEEFCCILPDTGPDEAKLFAERIQTALRAVDAGPLPLTVSMGVVASNRTTQTWERMVSQADDAMYEAKRTGKNKVVVHSEHIRQLMREMERPAAVGSPSPDKGKGSPRISPGEDKLRVAFLQSQPSQRPPVELKVPVEADAAKPEAMAPPTAANAEATMPPRRRPAASKTPDLIN